MSNLRETLNVMVANAIKNITDEVSEKLYKAVVNDLMAGADAGDSGVDLTPVYNEYTGKYDSMLRNGIIKRVEEKLASEGVEVEHCNNFGADVAWVTLYKSEDTSKQ